MTRRSRRELEHALAELERDTVDGTYDRDPLDAEEKVALAELFDTDPRDREDTDARDTLAALHRAETTDR